MAQRGRQLRLLQLEVCFSVWPASDRTWNSGRPDIALSTIVIPALWYNTCAPATNTRKWPFHAEPPLPVPKRRQFSSAGQRNAFRRRDEHQQSRSFIRWKQSLRRSPNSIRLSLRLSAITSQYFILCRAWLLFVEQPV